MNFSVSLTKRSNHCLVLVLVFIFVALSTYPKYLEILLDPHPDITHKYFFDKINTPLEPTVAVGKETHGSKITFRMLVPLLAKVTGVASMNQGRGIVLLYIFQSLLLLPFIWALWSIAKRHSNALLAGIFTFSCAGVYFVKAFFWDYDFWFDGYAFFFMMMGLWTRSKMGVGIFLSLACWTDERAVIALPGIFLFHLLQEHDFDLGKVSWGINSKQWQAGSSGVLLAGGGYALVRLAIGAYFNLSTPTGPEAGVDWGMIPYQLQHRSVGILLAFEGLWLLWPLTFYYAKRIALEKGSMLIWVSIITALILQILVSYSVYDITRSLSYAFPLFIIMYALVVRYGGKEVKIALWIMAACTLFVPTKFLIFFVRDIPLTIQSIPELKQIAKVILLSVNGY